MEQQPESTRYYALDKLGENAKMFETLAELFPVYRERMGKFLTTDKVRAKEIYDLLTKERERLASLMGDTRLCLLEIGEEKLAGMAATLRPQLAAFPIMTPDYSKLVSVLTAFAAKLPVGQTTNAAIIGRLMSNVRIGYYPTDLDHIKIMARGVAFPDGVTTNLLDPCCGEGIALRALATGNNCFTYGVEIDERRAGEAQERLHRVAFGSYFYSRISHDAFHVMLLNPPQDARQFRRPTETD